MDSPTVLDAPFRTAHTATRFSRSAGIQRPREQVSTLYIPRPAWCRALFGWCGNFGRPADTCCCCYYCCDCACCYCCDLRASIIVIASLQIFFGLCLTAGYTGLIVVVAYLQSGGSNLICGPAEGDYTGCADSFFGLSRAIFVFIAFELGRWCLYFVTGVIGVLAAGPMQGILNFSPHLVRMSRAYFFLCILVCCTNFNFVTFGPILWSSFFPAIFAACSYIPIFWDFFFLYTAYCYTRKLRQQYDGIFIGRPVTNKQAKPTHVIGMHHVGSLNMELVPPSVPPIMRHEPNSAIEAVAMDLPLGVHIATNSAFRAAAPLAVPHKMRLGGGSADGLVAGLESHVTIDMPSMPWTEAGGADEDAGSTGQAEALGFGDDADDDVSSMMTGARRVSDSDCWEEPRSHFSDDDDDDREWDDAFNEGPEPSAPPSSPWYRSLWPGGGSGSPSPHDGGVGLVAGQQWWDTIVGVVERAGLRRQDEEEAGGTPPAGRRHRWDGNGGLSPAAQGLPRFGAAEMGVGREAAVGRGGMWRTAVDCTSGQATVPPPFPRACSAKEPAGVAGVDPSSPSRWWRFGLRGFSRPPPRAGSSERTKGRHANIGQSMHGGTGAEGHRAPRGAGGERASPNGTYQQQRRQGTERASGNRRLSRGSTDLLLQQHLQSPPQPVQQQQSVARAAARPRRQSDSPAIRGAASAASSPGLGQRTLCSVVAAAHLLRDGASFTSGVPAAPAVPASNSPDARHEGTFAGGIAGLGLPRQVLKWLNGHDREVREPVQHLPAQSPLNHVAVQLPQQQDVGQLQYKEHPFDRSAPLPTSLGSSPCVSPQQQQHQQHSNGRASHHQAVEQAADPPRSSSGGVRRGLVDGAAASLSNARASPSSSTTGETQGYLPVLSEGHGVAAADLRWSDDAASAEQQLRLPISSRAADEGPVLMPQRFLAGSNAGGGTVKLSDHGSQRNSDGIPAAGPDSHPAAATVGELGRVPCRKHEVDSAATSVDEAGIAAWPAGGAAGARGGSSTVCTGTAASAHESRDMPSGSECHVPSGTAKGPLAGYKAVIAIDAVGPGKSAGLFSAQPVVAPGPSHRLINSHVANGVSCRPTDSDSSSADVLSPSVALRPLHAMGADAAAALPTRIASPSGSVEVGGGRVSAMWRHPEQPLQPRCGVGTSPLTQLLGRPSSPHAVVDVRQPYRISNMVFEISPADE